MKLSVAFTMGFVLVSAACGRGESGKPVANPTPVPAPEVTVITAGTITKMTVEPTRPAVRGAIKKGLGSVLSEVEVEPVMRNDRFYGWRLLKMKSMGWEKNDLRPGDIVIRVNGESLERPEYALKIFQSLETAKEIVFEYERVGRVMQQRTQIIE